MCDIYCKIMLYWFFFGGFIIAALIPVLYEIEGGEIKNLNSEQLKSLYFDYVKYRGALGAAAARMSVLDYYMANKGKYDSVK